MDMTRTGQKTYWHFLGGGRIPTEYELLSSRLLYYPGRGFEVETPLSVWFEANQKESLLKADDWEKFQDPRQTTYASYVRLQHAQETFVDGLLESMESNAYPRGFSSTWLEHLERILPCLRFLFHGMQMIACHIGHLAPSSRITLVALFQAADEMRRVQRMAYRMAQLRRSKPDFGASSLLDWETNSTWRPLRETLERLMTVYDWGEAFAGLNLGFKPVVETCFLEHLSQMATTHGDPLLVPVLASLRQDGVWHQQWSGAMQQIANEACAENEPILQAWSEKWRTATHAATKPFVDILG